MQSDVDVVIVGAGPVGLLLAIELTLGGVRVLVLERLAVASTAMKAGGIGPLGTEALQRRGMTDAFAAAEARSFAVIKEFTDRNGPDVRGKGSKFVGHFAGLSLIRRNAQKEPERRSHVVDQQAVESMLADRARFLGVDVRRECYLTNFTDLENAVDVSWTSPAGENQVSGSYLVGCDGGRSSVRKMAGFAFPGTPPTSTFYQAIAEIDRPELLAPGWHRTSGGVFSFGPLPGRLVMLDFNGPPEDRQAQLTPEELEGVLRRVSGMDVRVKAVQGGGRWTDNTRLVDTYRQGRVLLAGDAAHIHTPFGGQGMSLGLVDAQNLGWKLAAVIRGEMAESLLDTYTAERRPIAEVALANCLAQMAIMRPDSQSGAMRDLVANLLQLDDVNRLIGERMGGLFTRYDLGSQQQDVGRLIGDMPISYRDSRGTLYDLMQDGLAVLLDASKEGEISKLVAATTHRICCVAVDTGPSMLIRPDACIAWVGEEGSIDGLEAALSCWFVRAA